MQEVLIIEDDASLQTSIERVLTMSGYNVHSYSSAEAWLDDLPQRLTLPAERCVLMDVNLGALNGLEAQIAMRNMSIDIPIVFMSGARDANQVNTAWRNGAHYFLFKPFPLAELLEAIEGAFSIASSNKEDFPKTVDVSEITSQLQSLTPRQQQVLRLVASGQSNTTIAAQMQISARTVKMHREGIMHRLGFGHVADLVRFYEDCKHLML